MVRRLQNENDDSSNIVLVGGVGVLEEEYPVPAQDAPVLQPLEQREHE